MSKYKYYDPSIFDDSIRDEPDFEVTYNVIMIMNNFILNRPDNKDKIKK